MKTDGRRVLRVEREIQQCLSTLLISKYQGELPGFLTVGHVKMPGDLRSGKVFLSVFGESASLEKWLEFLNKNAWEIQESVSRQLGLRYCPRLEFLRDESTDKILNVEKIIHGLHPEPEAQSKSEKKSSDE